MSCITRGSRSAPYIPTEEEIENETLRIREQRIAAAELLAADEERAAEGNREAARLRSRQNRRNAKAPKVKATVVAAGPAVRVVFDGPPRDMTKADICNVEPVSFDDLVGFVDMLCEAGPMTSDIDDLQNGRWCEVPCGLEKYERKAKAPPYRGTQSVRFPK